MKSVHIAITSGTSISFGRSGLLLNGCFNKISVILRVRIFTGLTTYVITSLVNESTIYARVMEKQHRGTRYPKGHT